MNLAACLLVVAARRVVDEADSDAGWRRFEALVGQLIDPGEFRTAVAEAVAAGDLNDPVRILPGALQCRWQLELAPKGGAKLAGMLEKIKRAGNDRATRLEHICGCAQLWPNLTRLKELPGNTNSWKACAHEES